MKITASLSSPSPVDTRITLSVSQFVSSVHPGTHNGLCKLSNKSAYETESTCSTIISWKIH